MTILPISLNRAVKIPKMRLASAPETDTATLSPSDPLLDLVKQAQSGDQAAFEMLLHETETRVYNICYSVLRNPQEAEDATQTVYLRVWHALSSFRLESKFSTWLYRVTVNTCLNRKRSLRRQLYVVDDEETILLQRSQAPGPETVTEENAARHWLWGEVDRLSPKYSLVINLYYQQQLSVQEISETLSLPMGTVKAHLYRARKALAKRLAEREETGYAEA